MHQVIVDRLEEYLSGSSNISREFTAHLESCPACHAEVREMQEIGAAFAALRAPSEFEVPVGFYARVNARIESQQQPASAWRMFAWEPTFGRRVAFASLMALFMLGSFLITRETEFADGPNSPEQLISSQSLSDNPDAMMASLVAYRQ